MIKVTISNLITHTAGQNNTYLIWNFYYINCPKTCYTKGERRIAYSEKSTNISRGMKAPFKIVRPIKIKTGHTEITRRNLFHDMTVDNTHNVMTNTLTNGNQSFAEQ